MITRNEALDKAQAALKTHQLDALVAVSPWNVRYLAGTAFMTQRAIPDRLALVVVTPNQEPTFIYCSIEEVQARHDSWLTQLRGYREFAEDPIAILAHTLRSLGGAEGRIGLEMRYLVAEFADDLRRRLPGSALVAADAIFDRMRVVKTPGEIDHLARVALSLDTAIRTAFANAHPGMTEVAVAERLKNEAVAAGADEVPFMVLASGPRTFTAHGLPSATPLVAGDIIRTDVVTSWGGYVGDIARTAFVAPLQPGQADTYQKLAAIQQTVIDAMRPGVRVCDLYHLCDHEFARHGLPFTMPHIGHSIGLVLHEKPMLHPLDTTVLEPGMVFMVEPLVAMQDGVYHTEDLVIITDTMPQVRSRSVDWSQPLVIGA